MNEVEQCSNNAEVRLRKKNSQGGGSRSAVHRIIKTMKQKITRGNTSSDEWDENNLQLFLLVPLVQTAWARGAIARSEKNLIF